MLKFQIIMITILISCVAFTACERMQSDLNIGVPDPEPDNIGMIVETDAHKAWDHRVLEEAEGPGHGENPRTVYFNEFAAMANNEGTAYPAGSMIVKEVMNDDNTDVMAVVTMMKTEDTAHADHDGWVYGVGSNEVDADTAASCDGCHTKAPTGNRVFVSLNPPDNGQ